MKKSLVVFFLFHSICTVNAQTDAKVSDASNDKTPETLSSAAEVASTETSSPYVILKNKLHVDQTTYYSYADQVYLRMNNTPFNGTVYEKWRNGMMWWETSYKNGVKDGYTREWFKSGQLFKEAVYKDGNLIRQKCWDEEGEVFECD
jgi:antitoxin component YwqK of YwqJK toxin-antitoxin module